MENFTGYFFTQGILGVMFAGSLGVIWYQQRRIDHKDATISELQEKRKADTDTYTKSYTDVVREQTKAQTDTVNALSLQQQSINTIANALNSLVNGRK